MAHFLLERSFGNHDEVSKECREYFKSHDEVLRHREIEQFAERWVRIIENDDIYFDK